MGNGLNTVEKGPWPLGKNCIKKMQLPKPTPHLNIPPDWNWAVS